MRSKDDPQDTSRQWLEDQTALQSHRLMAVSKESDPVNFGEYLVHSLLEDALGRP